MPTAKRTLTFSKDCSQRTRRTMRASSPPRASDDDREGAMQMDQPRHGGPRGHPGCARGRLEWAALLPARVLMHLQALRERDGALGMPVDRLEHSLQCRTRAYRDNRSG